MRSLASYSRPFCPFSPFFLSSAPSFSLGFPQRLSDCVRALRDTLPTSACPFPHRRNRSLRTSSSFPLSVPRGEDARNFFKYLRAAPSQLQSQWPHRQSPQVSCKCSDCHRPSWVVYEQTPPRTGKKVRPCTSSAVVRSRTTIASPEA